MSLFTFLLFNEKLHAMILIQQKIAVGAATAFVGMAAYRAYAARKNSAS